MNLQQTLDRPTSQSGNVVTATYEYATDLWQRGLLYADVMRERGNQYLEHLAQVTPNVLSFEAELIMFGPKLERPVNYGLARIIPPEGVEIDPRKRPFRRGRSASRARPRHRRFQGRQRDWRRSRGPAIPATSSGSLRIRCRARRSRTSCGPRPPSWNG